MILALIKFQFTCQITAYIFQFGWLSEVMVIQKPD